jgi:hypothetical protein
MTGMYRNQVNNRNICLMQSAVWATKDSQGISCSHPASFTGEKIRNYYREMEEIFDMAPDFGPVQTLN